MKTFERWESEIRGYCRMWPTVFRTAHNSRQIDESGKSYVDFFAGAGVLNFGHNNERMKKAMIEFLEGDGVTHSLDMSTSVKRDFIQSFVDTILAPRDMDYKLQFMGPTGTNAVEVALKLARKVTGRHTVVAFNHGFHGMTLGSLACTANSYFRDAAGVPLTHVMHEPFGCEPLCAGCTLGCGLEQVDRLRARFADSSSGLEAPAAFVLETIQAEGGVKVAGREWLRAMQDLARDLGALFIVDDIQVGCGRTGPYFSFDGMDLDPDVICLAKGIGGFGTPMAMNLVKPEHDRHWKPGQHTGTFRGQGLSFVAGRVALSYFEDDELEKETRRKGAVIRDRLDPIAESFSESGFSVRGKGMIHGLDVVDGDLSKKIAAECFGRGLLISPCGTGGRVLKVLPPLTIPDDDLAEGLDVLQASVEAVMEAGT